MHPKRKEPFARPTDTCSDPTNISAVSSKQVPTWQRGESYVPSLDHIDRSDAPKPTFPAPSCHPRVWTVEAPSPMLTCRSPERTGPTRNPVPPTTNPSVRTGSLPCPPRPTGSALRHPVRPYGGWQSVLWSYAMLCAPSQRAPRLMKC
ncbi:hypothetical protein MPTK1_2g26510 [Marchantia polymorpha subsp. ruderalis]|uniref:Uncharacterized protein n=1 Tax=Marchantia polymorpha TaxID=3197 RepID=A0A2R6XB71_MARPO|nr:hypothetical protein MARPO_0025s0033 [Marchantia polymorpha]BBN03797.1 hypothetical protein Mp_2g26510 [Marchantia polymorpha subsp. ruderalis]|eukprot:PTQ43338.1 hypothetical protein MARPO_0025s0033 [Marchantia polymorpha]